MKKIALTNVALSTITCFLLASYSYAQSRVINAEHKYSIPKVEFVGNKLIVNEQPFEIKGVVYSGFRGKEFPAWFSNTPAVCKCDLEDYNNPDYPFFCEANKGAYDISNDRIKYDLAKIASFNANTIRTYSEIEKSPSIFFDEADKNGLKVIVGLTLPWGIDYSNPSETQPWTVKVLDYVKLYKNHPAVLVWNLGNEVAANLPNVSAQDAFFNYVTQLAAQVKVTDPNHPVGTTIIYNSNFVSKLEAKQAIDYIAVNVFNYDANGFGPGALDFVTQKGYIITEYATDSVNHDDVSKDFNNFIYDQTTQADRLELLANQISGKVVNNYKIGSGRLIGGTVEAYVDQPWKNDGWWDACYYGIDQDGWHYFNGMDGYEDREFLGLTYVDSSSINGYAVVEKEAAVRLRNVWQ